MYSEFQIALMVRRYHDWYAWNVLFYMCGAVFLSWGAFLLPSTSAVAMETRTGMSVTMVIVMLTIKFCCLESIPRSQQASMLERSSAANCVIVTLAAIACVTNDALGGHARAADGLTVAVLACSWTGYHAYLLCEMRAKGRCRREAGCFKIQVVCDLGKSF